MKCELFLSPSHQFNNLTFYYAPFPTFQSPSIVMYKHLFLLCFHAAHSSHFLWTLSQVERYRFNSLKLKITKKFMECLPKARNSASLRTTESIKEASPCWNGPSHFTAWMSHDLINHLYSCIFPSFTYIFMFLCSPLLIFIVVLGDLFRNTNYCYFKKYSVQNALELWKMCYRNSQRVNKINIQFLR